MSLRLPAEMKKRFEHMVNSGATALNRSHYMRFDRSIDGCFQD